jgi:hypothetical protein
MSVGRLPAVVEIQDLGDLSGSPAIASGGQCVGIWRVPAEPGSLFKRYTPEAAWKADPACLDRLIAQPSLLADAADRDLVAQATAWPTSRVVDGRRTVGVLMPEAPSRLRATWRSKRARSSPERHEPLAVDYLAKPNKYLGTLQIPAQTAADRVAICAMLAKIAALLERCGIVYADWSYSNAFWQPTDHVAYLIDLDGCSYGPREHVVTPNFDDPLTPHPMPVDCYVDRYRAALLVARCLTGHRDVSDVLEALDSMNGAAPETLLRILNASIRTGRPTLASLAAALNGLATTVPPAVTNASGVVGWRPAHPHKVPPGRAQAWRPAGRTSKTNPVPVQGRAAGANTTARPANTTSVIRPAQVVTPTAPVVSAGASSFYGPGSSARAAVPVPPTTAPPRPAPLERASSQYDTRTPSVLAIVGIIGVVLVVLLCCLAAVIDFIR